MTSELAAAYKSGSQSARVVTKFWAEHNLYCPNCSSPKLDRLAANNRHIRDKIRQQLQVLRDTNVLTRISHGAWTLK